MFSNAPSGADFNYALKPARLMCSPLNVLCIIFVEKSFVTLMSLYFIGALIVFITSLSSYACNLHSL